MIKKILKEMNEMRKMMGLSPISEQESPGGGGNKGSFSPRGGTGAGSAGSYISAGAFDPGGILTTSGRKKDRGELPEVVDITGGETGTFQTVDVSIPTDNIDTRASKKQKQADDKYNQERAVNIFKVVNPDTKTNDPGDNITVWDWDSGHDVIEDTVDDTTLDDTINGDDITQDDTDHDGPTITTWDPDDENPDPYDDRDPGKQRDPKPKGHNKTIRRAACCKKCKNGKFSNICDDNNKKERGCVYATISDCQLAKR